MITRTADHRYFVGDEELLGVTRILEAANVTDFSAPWYTDWTLRRGQMVHRMIALENEGTLDDEAIDPRLRGYLDGYRRFRLEVGGDVEFYEEIVGDLTIGAAGTFDLIIRHPADHDLRRRLYDVKPDLSAATAIQTAAYAMFARALYDRPVSFDRAALVLPGDGTYRTPPFRDPNDWHVFTAATRIAHWRQAHV